MDYADKKLEISTKPIYDRIGRAIIGLRLTGSYTKLFTVSLFSRVANGFLSVLMRLTAGRDTLESNSYQQQGLH